MRTYCFQYIQPVKPLHGGGVVRERKPGRIDAVHDSDFNQKLNEFLAEGSFLHGEKTHLRSLVSGSITWTESGLLKDPDWTTVRSANAAA